jgi:hypothetical protein
MEDADGEAAVAQAVEAYRSALLSSNVGQLDALCMDELSYGHSSGKVETKAEFLADAASGNTVWKWIKIEHPHTRIVDDSAISRYTFVAENAIAGTTNALRFGVVMIWQMHRGHWKLLLRQGYKL